MTKRTDRLPVGYIALSKASWLTPEIETLRKKTVQNLEKLPIELIHAGALTTSAAEATALGEQFRKGGVAAVIAHFVTFPVGATIPAFVQGQNAPIILLANSEAPTATGVWARNSFCGANMAAHTLRKLGHKNTFVFGRDEESAVMLEKPLRVAACISALTKDKIGLVGGRVPGFYTSVCDEMLLRKTMGVEVEIIDQLEIVDVANKLSDAEAKKALVELRSDAETFSKSVEHELLPGAKMFQAFNKIAVKYGLSSYAIRCWPEFSDIFGIAPCAIIGMLNRRGLISACEGDVLGAVLMQIQKKLTGADPFFADLISFDHKKNTAVVWHCGAAPVSLAGNFKDSRMRQHFRVDGGDKKGLVNEFPLKAGAVTLAQLDEDSGGYRMLIASGTALETRQIMRGNPLEVKFKPVVGDIIDTVMNEGLKHHYTLVHGDVADELALLCKWLGIKPIIVK